MGDNKVIIIYINLIKITIDNNKTYSIMIIIMGDIIIINYYNNKLRAKPIGN